VPHTLKVAALSPDKEKLAEVEGDINLSGPVVPTDWLQGMQVPMAIQFMAGTEGRYDLEITVDGHTIGVPMNVAVGPPPTPPAPPPAED
jgi:hypothetical protein